MHKIWEKPAHERIKRTKAIEVENAKFLSKLINISTRSMPMDKKQSRLGENVYRKNVQKSIKQANEDFGEKLIHLRSDLEYTKVRKSMEKYEKAKWLMHKNKRAKLPTLPCSKPSKGSASLLEQYQGSRKARTEGEEGEMEKSKNKKTLETIAVEF